MNFKKLKHFSYLKMIPSTKRIIIIDKLVLIKKVYLNNPSIKTPTKIEIIMKKYNSTTKYFLFSFFN